MGGDQAQRAIPSPPSIASVLTIAWMISRPLRVSGTKKGHKPLSYPVAFPDTDRLLRDGVEGPSVRKRTLAYCTQCEGSDSASQLFVGISPHACISRNVIPRVRPRVCCVQYATLNRYTASNMDCIP
jgi:hypothetical protein